MKNIKKVNFLRIIMWSFIFIYSAYILTPIVWIVFASLKNMGEIFQNPIAFPKVLMWSNYSNAWNAGVKDYFINSLIITFFTTLGVVLFSGMLAYALARIQNKYNYLIYILVIMGYAIPMHGVLVPLYKLESTLNLLNSLVGVILPGIAFGIPFAVIVLYTFLLDFPNEMEEAASIDGASHVRIFFQLVVPIARPAFITVAIFQIVTTWNEFLFASLILTNEEVKPITVGLAGFQGQWTSDWGAIMAAVIISVIPLIIVYVLFQKYLVNSLGGMSKG